MRRCPACNRTYADDSLAFCLTDGAPLEAATTPRNEPVNPAHSGPLRPTAKTTEVLHAPPKSKSSALPFVIIAALAAGLLLMTYLYFSKGENIRPTAESTSQSNRSTTTTAQQTTQTPTPSPASEANASASPLSVETSAAPSPAATQPSGANTENATPTQNASSPRQVEAGSFIFEFKQCKLSGITVTCEIAVVSQGLDRVLRLDSYTRLFDDADNEYECKQVKVGNTQGDNVTRKFVAGERTGVSLIFEQVSTKATKVTLLDIQGRPPGDDSFHAQFRNFPILR